MGCICCKPSAIEDSKESPRERLSSKTSSDLRLSRTVLPRREEGYHRVKDRYGSGDDGRSISINKQINGSLRPQADNLERSKEKMDHIVVQHPSTGSIPKAMEGEQVAAGWPPWLSAVAGEAIRGWVPRRADSFEKLDKVCFYLYMLVKLCLLRVLCLQRHILVS